MEEDYTGPRISITFRQLYSPIIVNPSSYPVVPKLEALSNGFMVNADRIQRQNSTSVNNKRETKPPSSSTRPPTSTSALAPEHLIIGDSMVKGLWVPGSVSICKSGIRPDEVLQMLPDSLDVIHPKDYDNVKTLTLVVGTNALNVKRPRQGIPLLDVVEDYEKLIHDLIKLFPNARIGLYNVLPRAYTCTETRDRIKLFNTIFDNHVVCRLKKVFWIRQFWDFLDDAGFLRNDL